MDGTPENYVAAPTGSVPRTHKHLNAAFVLACILVVGSLGVWFFAQNYNSAQGSEFSSADPGDVRGGLFLSLSPKQQDGSYIGYFPMLYEMAKAQLAYVPIDKPASGAQLLVSQVSVSPDMKWITFIGQSLSADRTIPGVDESPAKTQVYRAYVDGAATSDEMVARVQQAAEKISDNADAQKGVPSISTDGEVLYFARPEGVSGSSALQRSIDASTWEVHYVDKSGTDAVVGQGVFPKWIDGEAFVYLKNDGLYVHNLMDGSDVRVWGMEGVATTDMMFDLSNDGKLIAWTIPQRGQVYLIRVLDWVNNQFSLRGVINAAGTWPVISPDGKYVALETFLPSSQSDEVVPQIFFYGVDTLQQVPMSLSLDSFRADTTFMTEWLP